MLGLGIYFFTVYSAHPSENTGIAKQTTSVTNYNAESNFKSNKIKISNKIEIKIQTFFLFFNFTVPDLGSGYLLYGRKQWGAVETERMKKIPELKHPINFIMVTHVGVQTEPCYNLNDCTVNMRSYQDNAIATRNIPDIPANFYVSTSIFF